MQLLRDAQANYKEAKDGLGTVSSLVQFSLELLCDAQADDK